VPQTQILHSQVTSLQFVHYLSSGHSSLNFSRILDTMGASSQHSYAPGLFVPVSRIASKVFELETFQEQLVQEHGNFTRKYDFHLTLQYFGILSQLSMLRTRHKYAIYDCYAPAVFTAACCRCAI